MKNLFTIKVEYKFLILFCFTSILIFLNCITIRPTIKINSFESYRPEFYTLYGKEKVSHIDPIRIGKIGDYLIAIEDFLQRSVDDSQILTLIEKHTTNLTRLFRGEKFSFFYYRSPQPLLTFWAPYAQMDHISFFALPIKDYKMSASKYEKKLSISCVVFDKKSDRLELFDDFLHIDNVGHNKWTITSIDTVDKYLRMFNIWSKSNEDYFSNYCTRRLNKTQPNDNVIQSSISNDLKSEKRVFLNKSKEFYKKGKLIKSLEMLFKAYNIDPMDGAVHQDIGKILIELNKGEEAIIALEQTLELNYDLGETYYLLGKAYMIRRWYDKAIDAFQRCIELKVHHLPANVNIAKIYLYLGFKNIALQKADNLLNQYPNVGEVHYTHALIQYALSNDKSAVLSLNKAIDLNPNEKKFNDFLEYIVKNDIIK